MEGDGKSNKEKYYTLDIEYVDLLVRECRQSMERSISLLKHYAKEEKEQDVFLLLCEYYATVKALETALSSRLEEEEKKDALSEDKGTTILQDDEVKALNTLNLLLTNYEMRLKYHNISFLTH